MHKSFRHVLVILIFIMATFFAFLITFPSQKAYLVACDVGQGDALLFVKGTTQILVDGGPGKAVLECLKNNMPFWDRKIELVVNTHPEEDHLGGLLPVIQQYQIEQIVSDSLWMETNLFRDFLRTVRDKEIPVYSPQRGDRLKLDGFDLEMLWPDKVVGNVAMWNKKNPLASADNPIILGEKTVEPNEWSIVFLVSYRGKKILLPGDISSTTEEQVLAENQLSLVDILKVAHHGSKYSTATEWLAQLRPKLAIISVGKNPWGHPTEEVLKRLNDLDIKILRTDKDKIKVVLD